MDVLRSAIRDLPPPSYLFLLIVSVYCLLSPSDVTYVRTCRRAVPPSVCPPLRSRNLVEQIFFLLRLVSCVHAIRRIFDNDKSQLISPAGGGTGECESSGSGYHFFLDRLFQFTRTYVSRPYCLPRINN
ncbi:hypothetical protein BDZ94DRAFT_1258839 [Collybia nuda]|uniref:Uncharacterized protein n=1 Tax=Collybia nuda TaxID=64659 RepID=A0A9P6CK52_9AGAR|nr:hypothetical protein BDZ94DRAFT_1258839 [Collybia nuda]